MRADKDEWLDLQRKSGQEKSHLNTDSGLSGALGMLKQASVKAERLTNDQSWDYYLTLLSEWISKTNDQAQQFRSALESPDLVNPEQRRRFENYLMICNERATVLDAVINLPKQIIEGNDKVELELKDITLKNKT